MWPVRRISAAPRSVFGNFSPVWKGRASTLPSAVRSVPISRRPADNCGGRNSQVKRSDSRSAACFERGIPMKVFGRTDTGRVRSSNQDAFISGTLPGGAVFAVVCDGMGGANGGNVASALGIKVISDRLLEVYREGMNEISLHNLLESAIAAPMWKSMIPPWRIPI